MGASSWSYFVAFQEDINAALQTLRWDVFRAGDYVAPPVNEGFPSFEDFAPPDIWAEQKKIARWKVMYAEEKKLQEQLGKPQRQATSPDQALRFSGTEGTHSIIDISAISRTSNRQGSGGLSDDELIELFGTKRPTRSSIEERKASIQELRGRGRCTYIIAYESDAPSEIFFTGFSGD